MGTKPPVSRFDARGGWEAVKTPPLCRNARGRCEGGYKATHLAFRHEEVLRGGRNSPVSRFHTRGGWKAVKTPSIASKHKREVWGVGTKPPISRFDTRRCWGAVKTPPLCRNTRERCGGWGQSDLSHVSM